MTLKVGHTITMSAKSMKHKCIILTIIDKLNKDTTVKVLVVEYNIWEQTNKQELIEFAKNCAGLPVFDSLFFVFASNYHK